MAVIRMLLEGCRTAVQFRPVPHRKEGFSMNKTINGLLQELIAISQEAQSCKNDFYLLEQYALMISAVVNSLYQNVNSVRPKGADWIHDLGAKASFDLETTQTRYRPVRTGMSR